MFRHKEIIRLHELLEKVSTRSKDDFRRRRFVEYENQQLRERIALLEYQLANPSFKAGGK